MRRQRNLLLSGRRISSSASAALPLPSNDRPPNPHSSQQGGESPAASTCSSTLPRTIADLIRSHRPPWPPSLLSSFIARLSRPLFLHCLDVIQPPSSALRFFQHSKLHLPSSLFDDRAHFKMLTVLCRSSDLSTALRFLVSLHSRPPHPSLVSLHDRFFNALIRAYSRRGRLRDSLSLFRRMLFEFRVPPSAFSLNSLLSALLVRGRTNSARNLFDEMTNSRRITPDVCTFNTLIRGFCINGMVEEGFRYFREMEQWQCMPDIRTYNTLLDGLCRTGKVRTARNLMEGMRSKSPELLPNVISYTTVMRGLCAKGCIEDAVGLFKQMVSDGVEPNSFTFNTLIQGLCNAGEVGRMKEVMELHGVGGKGFKMDTCTCNILINCYCTMGRVDNAMKVFEEMPEQKLKADSATYSILIRVLCQAEDFRRAEELLDDMLEKKVLLKPGGSRLLMAAYKPILEYLCQNGKTKKAALVFKQLLNKGIMDISSFKTLILGHCKEGDLHAGHEIVVEMVRRDLVPFEEACEALLKGFMGVGDMVFAWKTFRKMLNSGHRPKTLTFHVLLKGMLNKDLVLEAGELIEMMLERNVRQNFKLSTEAAMAHYRNGLHERGLEIVRLLYDSGYSVKIESLIGLLCNGHEFLEAFKLLRFSIEKDQILGGEVYIMCITGLCQTGKSSEAFTLFYELNEKGKTDCISSCLMDLEVALGKQGKPREAAFVHKRRINGFVNNQST